MLSSIGENPRSLLGVFPLAKDFLLQRAKIARVSTVDFLHGFKKGYKDAKDSGASFEQVTFMVDYVREVLKARAKTYRSSLDSSQARRYVTVLRKNFIGDLPPPTSDAKTDSSASTMSSASVRQEAELDSRKPPPNLG